VNDECKLNSDGDVRDSMLMEDWLVSMEVKVLEPWSKYRDSQYASTKLNFIDYVSKYKCNLS